MMTTTNFGKSFFLVVYALLLPSLLAFNIPSDRILAVNIPSKSKLVGLSSRLATDENEDVAIPRRSFLVQSLAAPFIAAPSLLTIDQKSCRANAIDGSASSTANSEITSKIFIQLKGIPNESESFEEDVISIGLFGKDSPQPVSILEQLVSTSGYPAKCKPKEIRTLQREQLEANKVYNSCIEIQDTKGVNYDLSTVWRVVKDERIDIGAVSGKYVARESPTFQGSNLLKHDAEGVVSVRLGNDGGFGFTIYTGSGSNKSDLDETNIVVGKVIDGMNVVKRLNEVPVIQSSSVGYKALAGGDPSKRTAPSRACRYGSSELYCNEFKPLKKISIFRTGTLN